MTSWEVKAIHRSFLLAFLMFQYFSLTFLDWSLRITISIIGKAADVLRVLGMIITAIHFIKKEPNTWQKWAAGILNILFFLIRMGSSIPFLVLG